MKADKDLGGKKMITAVVGMIFVGTVLCAIGVTSAMAHDTWGVMDQYVFDPSGTPILGVVSSHQFAVPGKDFVKREKVEKAFFLGPDSKEIPAVAEGDTAVYKTSSPLKAKGTYLAVIATPAGFSSKTTDGYKQGITKKDAPDVVLCSYSEKFSKELFTVGAPGGGGFARELGQTLELVPLQDPAKLKMGDVLQVKVLFQGKPLKTTLTGTYAGFSDEPGTFAYSTQTNKDGVAKIKLIKNGTWLLLVKEKQDYPDKAVCDQMAYSASLTFHVK